MSTDYERYIRTDELLSLQKPLSAQVNNDELLFQVTHQSSELWMKQIVQDAHEAIRLMRNETGEAIPPGVAEGAESSRYPALPRAIHLLRRAAHIVGLLSAQILILEQMAPADYHQIRLALGSGSGQDSPGFNRILGLARPLTEAYEAVLAHRSLTPVEILRNPYDLGDMHDLLQALLEFDEQFSRFRQNHLNLVRREIGLDVMSIKGLPAAKLISGTQAFMFSKLWDAVSELTNSYNTSY